MSRKKDIAKSIQSIFDNIRCIENLPIQEKINIINNIKVELHKISPFKNEPVDCVLWVDNNRVTKNDYNPNIVAPPEMELLRHSIEQDGYTQPIVSWNKNGNFEVVDGFHRHRVGKECEEVRKRINGYLPIVVVNSEREEKGDRIASTIRHNRARGKHQTEAMSEIIIELKNRNWTNDRISRELGMEEDEILRLCQITGLSNLFSDEEFSKSWDVEDFEEDFIPLEDDLDNPIYGSENFRATNTNDPDRIFHTHDKWECYKAGFYNNTKEGMTKQQCEEAYRDFLSSAEKFSRSLESVINEWKYSCEHYLTNTAMNRIAWLGQAAMCYATGVPSAFRGGFSLLTEKQQNEANKIALTYLNKWLKNNNRDEVNMEQALSGNRQVDIY